MADKVDIKEFGKGFATPSSYWKSLSIGLKLGMLLIIGYAIYNLIFPKPSQRQDIVVQSGGTATIIQKQENKRRMIPFMEAFIGQSRNERINTGVRCGLRLEF